LHLIYKVCPSQAVVTKLFFNYTNVSALYAANIGACFVSCYSPRIKRNWCRADGILTLSEGKSCPYRLHEGEWGVEVKLHTFLNSVQDRDEWSVSHPARVATMEIIHNIYLLGSSMSPRAGLDVLETSSI